MTTTPTWVKLQFGDDWGKRYLALQPRTRHGSFNHSLGINAVDGEPVSIRFPDGTVIDTTITIRHHTSNVNDMGHCYSVSSQWPAAVGNDRGIKTIIELDQVEVTLDWAKVHEPADVPEEYR